MAPVITADSAILPNLGNLVNPPDLENLPEPRLSAKGKSSFYSLAVHTTQTAWGRNRLRTRFLNTPPGAATAGMSFKSSAVSSLASLILQFGSDLVTWV